MIVLFRACWASQERFIQLPAGVKGKKNIFFSFLNIYCRFGSTIDFYFHPDTHSLQHARNKNQLTIEKVEIRLEKKKFKPGGDPLPWSLTHMN
jgi:hypothetical protein